MDDSQRIDLSSESSCSDSKDHSSDGEGRRFIGVHFACCNVYARAYPVTDAHYEGRCPKCFGKIRFVVGEGGRRESFFRAQ